MKIIAAIISIIGVSFWLNSAIAKPLEENNMLQTTDMKLATHIQIQPKPGQETNLIEFLKLGAKLVAEHEPNTKQWFALQENDETFVIFDIFPDVQGRTDHFNGLVANALQENSEALVQNGWEEGVLANVTHSDVLAAHISQAKQDVREATYIELKAVPGKEAELSALLVKAAEMVAQNEPNTIFWCALKLDDNTFAIFDTFTSEAGRDEHFNGQAASALHEFSGELVQGGWENGVVKNIHNFKVIAER